MASFAEADTEEDNSNDNIWVAASNGDIERVRFLLASGVSVNAQDEYGYSPIHAATSYGEEELIRFLLANGANVELKDQDGDTPLLVCEQPEIYELLLEHGANPDAKNNNNEGIAEKVLDDDNIIMIQYLVQKGKIDESVVMQKYNFNEEDMMDYNEEEDEENEEDDQQNDEPKMS